jgi:hypothetical protein
MALTFPITNNIVLGAGRCFFAEETSSTVEGEDFRYLGDSSALSLSANTEKVEIDSSDAPVAETLVSITKKVSRTGKLTLRHASPDNWALFVMGDKSTVTQTATGGNTIITTAVPGRYYKIGNSSTNTDVYGLTIAATGIHHATTGGTATGAAVTGTKWEYDGNSGLLYFTTGSGVTGRYRVDYTKTATSHSRVDSSGTGAKIGTFLFVSDNTAGDEIVLRISRCEIAPDGEAALKSRDNPTELGFSLNILTRSSTIAQVTINGAPA